tara:strand:+ start:159 stop:314 length:156 start_codon:yes stop_codon:yes gene_type:complete
MKTIEELVNYLNDQMVDPNRRYGNPLEEALEEVGIFFNGNGWDFTPVEDEN